MLPRLKIEIETGNDAFEGQPGEEVARILRELADMIEAENENLHENFQPMPLLDLNGNRVGYVSLGY